MNAKPVIVVVEHVGEKSVQRLKKIFEFTRASFNLYILTSSVVI